MTWSSSKLPLRTEGRRQGTDCHEGQYVPFDVQASTLAAAVNTCKDLERRVLLRLSRRRARCPSPLEGHIIKHHGRPERRALTWEYVYVC